MSERAPQDLDQRCINTIRFLAVDAVQKANSGHPGMPMGAAPAAYVLWTRHLKLNPADPAWPDRDRFVLSAGHGCMLLYSLLHLTGYDLSLDDIKDFRQWGSRTPGHPEHGLTPGVETTTGPLGQGFANAVGMAIAEAALAARFNRPSHPVVDHFTYVMDSDGDMMEGVASEAASLAGHLGLGKLIVLYDDNHISIEGSTDIAFTEDVCARFDAYGWHTQRVSDGNDVAAIDAALAAAKAETARPSLIAVRSHIGYGAPHKQDTAAAHGEPLGAGRGQGRQGEPGLAAAAGLPGARRSARRVRRGRASAAPPPRRAGRRGSPAGGSPSPSWRRPGIAPGRTSRRRAGTRICRSTRRRTARWPRAAPPARR